MKVTTLAARLLLIVALATGLGIVASTQVNLSNADIQRLQTTLDEASSAVTDLRPRDMSLASQLQAQLDDARDEIAYLKVKLRKNEAIARSEYTELRDRIDGIRDLARGNTVAPVPTAGASGRARDGRSASAANRAYDIPVGTEFDVRLQSSLSSATAQVEDHFEATTIVDLRDGDRIVVPAGSVMRGLVTSVKPAGRIERTGSLAVAFDRITIGGRAYPIRATVTQAIESEGVRGEAAKIGTGAGVGAVIGAILGGAKGALAGILIGGGGTMAATEGKDVELPPGTVLRVRLDSGLSLR